MSDDEMSYPSEILKCNKCGHRFGTPIDKDQHERLCKAVRVTPVDKWGTRPLFQAKVGTMSSSLVLVRGAHRIGQPFEEGEYIYFVEHNELEGRSTSMGPQTWHNGHVWKIEDNRLYINRV